MNGSEELPFLCLAGAGAANRDCRARLRLARNDKRRAWPLRGMKQPKAGTSTLCSCRGFRNFSEKMRVKDLLLLLNILIKRSAVAAEEENQHLFVKHGIFPCFNMRKVGNFPCFLSEKEEKVGKIPI